MTDYVRTIYSHLTNQELVDALDSMNLKSPIIDELRHRLQNDPLIDEDTNDQSTCPSCNCPISVDYDRGNNLFILRSLVREINSPQDIFGPDGKRHPNRLFIDNNDIFYNLPSSKGKFIFDTMKKLFIEHKVTKSIPELNIENALEIRFDQSTFEINFSEKNPTIVSGKLSCGFKTLLEEVKKLIRFARPRTSKFIRYQAIESIAISETYIAINF